MYKKRPYPVKDVLKSGQNGTAPYQPRRDCSTLPKAFQNLSRPVSIHRVVRVHLSLLAHFPPRPYVEVGCEPELTDSILLQTVRLSSLVSLRAEVGSGGSTLGEIACEKGVDDRAENDLSPASRLLFSMPTFNRGLSDTYPV